MRFIFSYALPSKLSWSPADKRRRHTMHDQENVAGHQPLEYPYRHDMAPNGHRDLAAGHRDPAGSHTDLVGGHKHFVGHNIVSPAHWEDL